MARLIRLLLGTKKGLFLLESDAATRADWSVRGPLCDAWPIMHAVADPADGAILASGGNEWFGPAVWRSGDGGATWTHSSAGLSFGDGEPPIRAVWSLAKAADGAIWAGVEPAGPVSQHRWRRDLDACGRAARRIPPARTGCRAPAA